MAQVLVRNLEEDVKRRLARRARKHGRSTEAEVREILRNAVRDKADDRTPLGAGLVALFAGKGLDADIPEWRGEIARPAEVDG